MKRPLVARRYGNVTLPRVTVRWHSASHTVSVYLLLGGQQLHHDALARAHLSRRGGPNSRASS
ncbi:hypothetical protein [Archangium sp.]|uniref:hypothetical protein n=1 Tax=Archangium sp. TaxID=1872627 RepID=UPI00286A7719|nr:hypothetical protein [Archangium sp.]